MKTGCGQAAPTRELGAEVPFPWLTIEKGAYGLILMVSLAVRLARLGQWPLLEAGANTALAAWRTIHGSAWRPAYYVPLLYDANLLLFGVFRASDMAARLLPALAGSALVVLPYFARDLLGRRGALAASLLLAFSPSWVFFSRTADGPVLTAAASAVLLLAASGYARGRDSRCLRVGAVALGLGLTAGPGIYTLLVSALLLGLVWWWRGRGDRSVNDLRVAAGEATSRENLLVLVGVFLLFGSGFLANPGGIGASVELAGHWIRSLAPGSTSLSWWAYVRTLMSYEFLTLALATVGAIRGLRRRDALDTYLIVWVGVVLALGMALGHRDPGWILDALLPLVILAARGFEGLWSRVACGASLMDGVVVLAGLPILVFGFLELASYTYTGQEQLLVFVGIAWLGLVAAWVAYLLWAQSESAVRVGLAWLTLVMTVMTVRATTAVAYQTGRDPREGLVHWPASVQIRDLEALVSTLSSRQAGDPHLLDIDYERELDPWLSWYLRDYPRARETAYVGTQHMATALVTSLRPSSEWPAGYLGQRFRLRETWPAQRLSAPERLRWLFYRDPVGVVQATEVHVWVHPPTAR